jgi:hypothetical protein
MNREKQDSAYDMPGFRVIYPGPIRMSHFAQTAAVNGRRLLSYEHIE